MLAIALFAVFVYATHATQLVALRALRLAGNRALYCAASCKVATQHTVPDKTAAEEMGGYTRLWVYTPIARGRWTWCITSQTRQMMQAFEPTKSGVKQDVAP